MPLEQVREHLLSTACATTLTFDEVVGVFISAVHHQGEVSTEREPFTVSDQLEQAVIYLCHHSYLTKSDTGYLWTQKVKPIMVANYLWSEDGESYDTRRNLEAEAQARKMMKEKFSDVGWKS